MDGEIIAIVIAQNGLMTASTLILAKVAALDQQAQQEEDSVKKRKLLASSKKKQKLAAALKAADAGLGEYLAEASKL